MLNIATSRLDLVPATLALLNAELESHSALALLLCARVPDEWPPGEYDRSAIEHFKARLAENPNEVGWYGWYALSRSGAGEPPTLIGAGGFFGPPNAEGWLEIGYSVVSQFSGLGYATELVRALADHAFDTGRVKVIVAHTGTDNVGSARVLEKAGFCYAGRAQDDGIVRYVMRRSAV